MKKILFLLAFLPLLLFFPPSNAHAADCDTVTWNEIQVKSTTVYTLSGKLNTCINQTKLLRIDIQFQKTQQDQRVINHSIPNITLAADGTFSADADTLFFPGNWRLLLRDGGSQVKNSDGESYKIITIIPVTQTGDNPGPVDARACNATFPATFDPTQPGFTSPCPASCPNLIPLQKVNEWQCSTESIRSAPLGATDVKLVIKPKAGVKDSYIINQAYATYIGGNQQGGSSSGVIDINSVSLLQIFEESAKNASIPLAFLKAIAKTETSILGYTDQDVISLSQKEWWAGRIDDGIRNCSAAQRQSSRCNDLLVDKGFAYNTCQYLECGPGADVRGVMQFELQTWKGVIPKLRFSDGHEPDRRYIKDNIFGSGLHIRAKADQYESRFHFSQNPTDWIESQVRALATTYCTGNPDGNPKDVACRQGDMGYDDLVWKYYQEFNK